MHRRETPPKPTHTTHKPMTQSTALINEITDQELDLATLTEISGGGKKAKKKFGKWVEKTFGNGDGVHTFGDYADELVKIAGILIGCLLYTSPSPRDRQKSRMPSSA